MIAKLFFTLAPPVIYRTKSCDLSLDVTEIDKAPVLAMLRFVAFNQIRMFRRRLTNKEMQSPTQHLRPGLYEVWVYFENSD